MSDLSEVKSFEIHGNLIALGELFELLSDTKASGGSWTVFYEWIMEIGEKQKGMFKLFQARKQRWLGIQRNEKHAVNKN